jgi:hypothetical protein
MQNQFWHQRDNQLNVSINNNITSIYTWALLLKKDIENKRQWALDKKNITGDAYTGFVSSIHANELEFANNIISFKTGVINPFPTKSQDEENNHLIDKHVDSSNECEWEEVEEENPKHTSKTIHVKPSSDEELINNVLAQQQKEQDDLDNHIGSRRKLLEEQNKLFNINDYQQILDDKPTPKVKFSLDVVGRDDNIETDPQLDNTIAENNDKNIPIPYNGVLTPMEKKVIDELEAAPTITPLLRFTGEEREKLLYEIFKQAKENVEKNLGNLLSNMSSNDIQKLIDQEGDRLLDLWMEKNAKNFRTDFGE